MQPDPAEKFVDAEIAERLFNSMPEIRVRQRMEKTVLNGNFDALLSARQGALLATVSGLYEVFRPYQLRNEVPGCACCVFADDQARIHSKPLKELTAEDLDKYARKALTTWGDEDDFRHFLPRLFELLPELETNAEIVVGKLRAADWRNWPLPEQSAIEKFLLCHWLCVLAQYPPQYPAPNADDALCTAAQALDDLTPLLALWDANDTPPAAMHLADFVSCSATKYSCKSEYIDGFWEDRPDQVRQVIQWLQSQPLRDRIKNLLRTFPSSQPGLAAAFSEALQMLEINRHKLETP